MKKMSIFSIVLGLTLSATAVFAVQDVPVSVTAISAEDLADQPSTYDKIWEHAKLVKGSSGPVRGLALTGRLQADAHAFESEDHSNNDDVWRRFRFGFKASILDNLVLHSEMDLNMNEADSDQWDQFYLRLTDSYLAWSPSKKAKFKLGKQSAGFTLDGATSSKKLIVPERSIVAGNLWFGTEYFTGLSVGGDVDSWSYKVGGFSSSGEAEFGHFDAGYFGLFSIGHTVGENGSLRIDYVYNDPDYSTDYKNFKDSVDVGTADHEHVLALVYEHMINEKLGVWTDIATSKGIEDSTYGVDQSDLLGIDIMPFYNISDAFQVVLQYAGVTSLENEQDVRLARYASRNKAGRVETAHNILLGFNWYLYGHKLKWQNAIEYNYGENQSGSGDDYRGYGGTSAFRLSW